MSSAGSSTCFDTARTTGTTVLWVAVIAVLVCLAVRTININADPVTWNPETGYHIDEGFKTLSPRNLATFGATHWDPQDQYSGWMRTSPATQWPYYIAFKLLGPQLGSARLVTLLYTAFMMLTAVWFLWRRLPAAAVLTGMAMLLADPGLFIYSRSALFETSIAVWLYVALFAAASLPRDRDILAAGILLVVAIAATICLKQSALLYFAPPLLACLGLYATRHMRITRTLVLISGVAAAVFAAVLFKTRGIWVHKLGLEELLVYPQSVFLNTLEEVSPIAVILGQLVVLDLALRRRTALFKDRYRACLAAIIILVPLAYGLFKYHPTRYLIPVLPAGLLLAAEWFSLRHSTPQAADGRRASLLALCTMFLAAGALTMTVLTTVNHFVIPHLPVPQGEDPGFSNSLLLKLFLPAFAAVIAIILLLRSRWRRVVTPLILTLISLQVAAGFTIQAVTLGHPQWNARAIRQTLTAVVSENQSVGGNWAPFFTAGTGIHALYMRPDMNNPTDPTVLRPDYFLYSNTWYDRQTLAAFRKSSEVSLLDPLVLGHYHKQTILLYSLKYSDAGPTPKRPATVDTHNSH